MNKSSKFSPEVRERAVRMVQEHRGEYPSLWAAVESIAPKIGCVPQTLLEWVKREDVDAGTRPGVTSSEAQRVKDLEREVKELRRANEILKLASAFFAQAELDRQRGISVRRYVRLREDASRSLSRGPGGNVMSLSPRSHRRDAGYVLCPGKPAQCSV
jgi:transposase-like protein